jgi:hypothetical protein
MTIEHSRAVRLAAMTAGRGESELERTLDAARIVVSVDSTLPGALLTARTLLTTLRRLPGRLVLERDTLTTKTLDELATVVAAIDPERALTVGRSADATVRVHVGTGRGDQAIRIVPEGHGAHIAGQRRARLRPARAPSGLGCIYTAALGAAEAFKYTAQIRPERRVLHRHLRFCPVSLTNDLHAAPELPPGYELAFTLVGIGAIGSAVVLIISELDVCGTLVAVDFERYGPENRGTYSLGGAREAATEPEKVALAHAALPRFDVVPFRHPVEELPAAIDANEIPWLSLVVSGLDTPAARRATQRLWPDQLIDAATGDTMLGLHEHLYGGGPCLICFFPEERSAPSAVERLAEMTGLPVELLVRGSEHLREEHLRDVTPEQRALLVEQIGKPVCGLARAVGLTELDAGLYRPSVPFISMQAAALAVGRMIATGARVDLPNLVQYDGLIGPQTATLETMRPVPGCYCQARRATIKAVRTRRAKRVAEAGIRN